jgi:hypothetical protein
MRPLDQPRADEGDGGAGAKQYGDNGERVHSGPPVRPRIAVSAAIFR